MMMMDVSSSESGDWISDSSMASLPPSLPCINDVLSHHLLVEVFARVSYRDAFRCRSVCKLWLSCLHDDPSFVKRFIHQRIREKTSSREDRQLDLDVVHVQCNYREMLLVVTPSCGSIPSAPRFSLNFLPFVARWDAPSYPSTCRLIVGSSNGLLLCTMNHEIYYICNPLTKQWLALPARHKCHRNVQIGFICDPFYHVGDGDDEGSIALNDQFSIKVVRLPSSLGNAEGSPLEIDVEIFSSQTGCWITSTVLLPNRLKFDELNPQLAIPYGGRLYWLVEPCDVLIYDPNKNEFLLESHEPPSEAMYSFAYWGRKCVAFKGFSLCQGSFWVGQLAKGRLRVFVLTNGEWCLRHDVHILQDMHCSSSLVKQSVQRSHGGIDFQTMHPNDPMLAYLSLDGEILECNFRDRTIKVVAELENCGQDRRRQLLDWFNVLTFPLPLWPTPLPLLPAASV